MRTRFFFLVYVAANLGLVLYGVLALVRPGILLESFLVRVYQFPEDAARATPYLEALFRLLGLFNIIPGMLGLLLLRRMRMSWQAWILRSVIVSTTFAYLGPIVFDNTVGSIGPFEIVEHVLFALVVILGLILWRDRNAGRGLPHPVSPKSVAGSPSTAAKVDASDITPRLALTRIGVWTIKRLASPLQRWVYRASGGRVFSTIGPGRNVLLLTTKGRRTGKNRTTPVFYLREGASVVICNVNPEHERINPWVVNLRAHPVAQLQIGRETGPYRAREATDAETERFWPRLIALWPAYRFHYERGGHRAIFVLERT